RTSFPERDGVAVQQIVEDWQPEIEEVDLSGLGPEEREKEAQRYAHAEAIHVFDLARGPLLRVKLLQLAEQEHALLTTMHHIISDGWSMGLLVREFGALYEAYDQGEGSPLAELDLQYADYAV